MPGPFPFRLGAGPRLGWGAGTERGVASARPLKSQSALHSFNQLAWLLGRLMTSDESTSLTEPQFLNKINGVVTWRK